MYLECISFDVCVYAYLSTTVLQQNKETSLQFSLLLLATYKFMHKHIINSSVICKHRHNLSHVKTIVTIRAVETTVMTTETTQHTL